ncbi:MAG TPA: GEVED domain-containing protein [Candidatus Saccharibacteria bacterium]|jgi:hypothetical protein|nr:GEVED domain-containing protein [Candidatus Saccharibacteria bacterium]HMT55316.1 GEVED domain-containing protein [Candidatus Saccharibacteria bacterium]
MKKILLSSWIIGLFGLFVFFAPRSLAASNTDCSLLESQLLITFQNGTDVIRYNADTASTIDSSFFSISLASGHPHEAIMVDEDTLWLASGTEIVQVDIATGATGTPINTVGVVHGLTLGPDGNAYAYIDGPSVVRIDTNSPYTITTIINAGDGGLSNEYSEGSPGIEFGPDGNLYVVSERNTGTSQSSIKRYDGNTFTYIDDFVAEDTGLWYDLGFHTDGYLYVTDHDTGLVRYNASTGALVGQYSNDPGAYTIDFAPNGGVLLTILAGDVLLYTAPLTSTIAYDQSGPLQTKTATYIPPACYDWGDAANTGSIGSSTYSHPVELIQNAARHLIQFHTVSGTLIDDETDGQPSADALGDDATDDEDSITFSATTIDPGDTVNATFTAEGRGVGTPVNCMKYVNVWVDINGDGDWDDVGDQVVDGQFLGTACDYDFSFTPTATDGPIMIRSRYSTVRDVATTGGAPDGEVEDYALNITSSTPTPTPTPTPSPTPSSTEDDDEDEDTSNTETAGDDDEVPAAPDTGKVRLTAPLITISMAGISFGTLLIGRKFGLRR